MSVYCVFEVFEFPSYDEKGNFDGTFEKHILKGIFRGEQGAKDYIKDHPELKLKKEEWNVQ